MFALRRGEVFNPIMRSETAGRHGLTLNGVHGMKTKPEKKLGTPRLAKLLGVEPKRIDRWVEQKILRPAGRGRYQFNPLDVLTCAIVRDLRARGIGLGQIKIVANWLQCKGWEALQAEWALDRVFLMTIGETEPFPRLWKYAELFENDELPLPEAFAMNLPLAIIDLRAAHQFLINAAERDGGDE